MVEISFVPSDRLFHLSSSIFTSSFCVCNACSPWRYVLPDVQVKNLSGHFVHPIILLFYFSNINSSVSSCFLFSISQTRSSIQLITNVERRRYAKTYWPTLAWPAWPWLILYMHQPCDLLRAWWILITWQQSYPIATPSMGTSLHQKVVISNNKRSSPDTMQKHYLYPIAS